MGYWHSMYNTKRFKEIYEKNNGCDFYKLWFDGKISDECQKLYDSV